MAEGAIYHHHYGRQCRGWNTKAPKRISKSLVDG
jgi:hypothetical protein